MAPGPSALRCSHTVGSLYTINKNAQSCITAEPPNHITKWLSWAVKIISLYTLVSPSARWRHLGFIDTLAVAAIFDERARVKAYHWLRVVHSALFPIVLHQRWWSMTSRAIKLFILTWSKRGWKLMICLLRIKPWRKKIFSSLHD